ncbi:MAG: competence/damage-inducible protein A [Oscillospiraceae bacterium]|jgi:nicotinamide-nucleotide amidase|nr:competence/damage-inducible protein A [Oscillospiraceae bacterium]
MTHTAEIISVGTELLLGNIINTDARDISVALSRIGINVFYHSVVGDNAQRVTEAVNLARTRADIIITTGGLGPTYDDLTKKSVAAAFGRKLVFHENEAEKIRAFFKDRLGHAEMTPNNLQQAYLPEGCVVFDNGCGTAPGCAIEADGIHALMLPGPPRECRAMLEASAIPYLEKLSDSAIFSHNIHIFGMGESSVEARLEEIMRSSENPTLAPYAKDSEVMLRVTAKAAARDEAEAMMDPIIARVRAELGDIIYGIDTGTLENTVVSLLRARGMTLAVAESCTGGLLSKRITDIPGASKVFLGGVIAYTDGAKTTLVGVPRGTIEKHGVVSPEVAEALAMHVRESLGADIALGITGVAGPGADEFGNPEGTVHIALASSDGVFRRSPPLFYDRTRIRVTAASHALDMARRYLDGLHV